MSYLFLYGAYGAYGAPAPWRGVLVVGASGAPETHLPVSARRPRMAFVNSPRHSRLICAPSYAARGHHGAGGPGDVAPGGWACPAPHLRLPISRAVRALFKVARDTGARLCKARAIRRGGQTWLVTPRVLIRRKEWWEAPGRRRPAWSASSAKYCVLALLVAALTSLSEGYNFQEGSKAAPGGKVRCLPDVLQPAPCVHCRQV